MGIGMKFYVIVCLLASIHNSHGCTMDGVSVWQLPITVRIEDYQEGIIFQRTISDIGGFTLTSYNELNGGPYLNAAIEDSSFVLQTNEAYKQYEENETSDLITLTYSFSCTNGVTLPSPLTIRIEINDNNNNPPLFKTPDTAASATTTYDFTIAPPVPPGYLITNCVSDIIVRDIDLTTYRIDFEIEDNPYFEIAFDEAASTDAKEFKAVLRTTSFIRTVPEPIVLTISATDVDETGDPPITRSTTVTVHGSSEFELPLEPVFSEAFYLANYTDADQIVLEKSISLQQGYDELVQFSLDGDYAADHFSIATEGSQVVLSVTNALPSEALQEAQMYLVLRAAREYTSGASAAIVVQLPEVVALEFERPLYEGEIEDNSLRLTQLILSQGYQGSDINVTIEDYSSFFTASVAGNVITLSMTPLDDNIIQENNFINLRVTASTGTNAATALVTLEIVKDDVTTPAFERPLYTGTYDSIAGLTIDSILLVQGFDETVTVSLSGEHESYFELVQNGATSTLRVAGPGLPSHILSESHLLLSLLAAKPRTVGANAVVSISLPGARELQFEASSYKGSLRDNILTLEPIILNVGYDDDVTFSLSGDYSTSFAVSNVQNQVTIHLPSPLPEEVISENNFIMLTLNANGLYALPTTAAVLVEILKDDVTTPVFSQPIYYGTYLGSTSIDIANISLIQGHDANVMYTLQGDNSEYFGITLNGNDVILTVESNIPEEVAFREKAFVFNIFAEKLLTVGGNAAIVIKFNEDLTEPAVMKFAQNTYIGSLENNTLTLESIVLETGFAVGTQFQLIGDHAAFFTYIVRDNILNLEMASELSNEILENNKFIVLELEARRDRAVSVVAGIIIDLVKEEVVIPVFNQAFYSGVYTEENALQFQETISLAQGFDETVVFGLEGESSAWFAVVQNGNSATVVSTSVVPQVVLDSHHQLLFKVVAYKPDAINGHAAISIDLPKDVLEQEVLRFVQSSYEGRLDGSELQVPTITLSNEITENVLISLSGAYATYFSATRNSNIIQIELVNDLPSEVISNNEFIILDMIASKADAVSGYTALILSIVKEPTIVTPVFEQPYYTGEISEQGELLFEHTIRLIQGFDESVSFTLNGDGSERFILTQSDQNSLTLEVAEGGMGEMENIRHFVFSVVASKAGSISGHAAIVIHNADSTTSRLISFSQTYYKGSLEENRLTMEPISIVEGYSSDVQLILSGDYAEYFQLVGQDGTFTLQLVSNIPNEIIEAQKLLIYSLEAYSNDARTQATVIVELFKDNVDDSEALTFDEAYYIASYSPTSGVMADIQLRVATGYDSNMTFTVDGAIGTFFNIQHNESIVTVSLVAPLPLELFIDNQPVIFAINAINSAGKTTTATIVVALEGELSELIVLGFERNNYLGRIENGSSFLEPIALTQGYSVEVQFTLQGDLSSYFSIYRQDSTINIELQSVIPEQDIPENLIIVLELQATAAQALSATTTIVFEIVAGQELAFNAAYYVGEYSEGGLVFDSTIALELGYDENVQFSLEGEHAQWFKLQIDGNAVTLITSNIIPPAILENNHQLIFIVSAQKHNSNIATSTIVISLIKGNIDVTILGFERASYFGTIEHDILSVDPIVLNEGFTDTVTFTLQGDLASYFNLLQQGSTIDIVLHNAIPDQALPANGIVLLELRASAPQAVAATATIVVEVRHALAVDELAFSAAYYIGQYSESEGLAFDTTITLDVGYDQDVQFSLDGEHSQWFALEVQGNAVTLTTSGAIPPAILVNNHQLVFRVLAHKPNSNTASATVVISLVDDYTGATLLGFEQASYLGAIENDVLSLEPIVLNEGYTTAVTFALHGDLASYFNLQQQGSTIAIVLHNAIPDQALPANGIVLLELRASAPQAVAATATIVVEVRHALAVDELAFSAAYYVGQYSESEGLAFDTTITLDVGYDQDVQFSLDGEHSQWFALEVQGNAVTLTTTGAIPPAILVNNHQLVFRVLAHKPNSNTASATVVISLVDDYTGATLLGFEQASYLGAIENDVLSLQPIVLNEGYTTVVTFALHGDLASYFNLQQQGSTVNVILQSAIPDQALPANGIVLLELRASAPQAVAATATIVVEARHALAVDELAFSAAYYIGQYSESEGLAFDTTITLDVGYDQDVQFSLDGEHSQWFALEVQGNAVTLTTTGAIPPAILVNNHQLVFRVFAHKPNSNTASATVVISLVDDYTGATLLGFEQASYLGAIENDVLSLQPIVLNEGYTTAVTFALHGDLASYFNLQQQGSTVNVILQSAIPDQALPANGIVLLELRASAPQAVAATATIVVEARHALAVDELAFSAAYYIGQYSESEGLAFDTTITLDVGYDQDVQFSLDGEHSQWFALEVQGNAVTLTTTGAIPPAILVNNHQLVFRVLAHKPNSNTASATVVISLVDDYTGATLLGFEQASYLGAIENDVLSLEPIILNEGYTDAVTFALHGDLASYFNLQQQGPTVNVILQSAIPDQALPANGIVLLELRASAPQAVAATATIVVEARHALAVDELAFSAAYYIGQYSESEGLAFDTTITLDVGYDQDVQFSLDGEHSQWFALEVQGNAVTLTTTGAIPPAILVNNHQLVFRVFAHKPNSNTASATVVISLVDDYTGATVLGFEQASYLGAIENDVLSLEPIILNEGYTNAVTFALYGDLASYFNLQQQGSTVNVILQSAIPDQALPANGIVLLELRASAPQAVAATATIVVEARHAIAVDELAFSAAYYIGQYSESEGLAFDTSITLDEGYDQVVEFTLEGEFAQWFAVSVDGNTILIHIVDPIPSAVLEDVRNIIMTLRAFKPGHTASAIVVISVIEDSGSTTNEAFDKVLYQGTISLNVVQHEPITITGYNGGAIEVLGVYRELFSASVSGDTVVVGASGTLALPDTVSHVALELQTGGSSAVLIFDVIQSETPEPPTVAFDSPSYVLLADTTQTGLLGQLTASASNGESVAYSLAINDAHLRERIFINNDGELHLSAPTNSGVYSFEAIATSTITQVQATASVQLTVAVSATCGDDHTLPPLIILDRDEEEPHDNLVVLDSVAQEGCRFRLTNRWPLDQDWLYVDETGLHARSIDREDPRIAFMALSQVQVELVLECDNDTQNRAKRSLTNPSLDLVGPYEYGSNKWILTDTILYNSRRSFVNLIVNDINDNYPMFVGYGNVPVVCGYPIPELEDIILPRALAELKATDADVGENAALSFWSSSELLAVSPSTGSVHVRDGASLSHDQILTVSVTDLNGREGGLTSSIQLMVKLIDTSHIAVVTVRNAFLDQEETIISNISSAVGYEVKVLSSAVISDDPANSENARHKRDVTAEGASLQLYVYGVIDREPVTVNQLANDITENVLSGVDVTSTISLEDYLEGREIYGDSGRDTGLLVATIVLSVLLFILIVAIALWSFLRWRKARNYEQFSDANSVASRNEPLDTPPKLDALNKPRLNIDELKRSERRLQEMLDAPREEVAPKAQTSQVNTEEAFDTIINIAPTDATLPIVIQSIDKLKDDANSADEDEFGERKSKSRRKSVVTFNENVEKFIHVEDIPDDNSSDLEVYKF